MSRKPTIARIAKAYRAMDPDGHYFDRGTLRFFGQTMRSFTVSRCGNGWKTSAPMRDSRGTLMGESVAYWSKTLDKTVFCELFTAAELRTKACVHCGSLAGSHNGTSGKCPARETWSAMFSFLEVKS
jgi:hypothetical protein